MGQITVAGVAGLEPTNDGVKVRCLATWLYPNVILLNGEPIGIRTQGTRLRRPLLYPAELWARTKFEKNGADDENRTHAISLEG